MAFPRSCRVQKRKREVEDDSNVGDYEAVLAVSECPSSFQQEAGLLPQLEERHNEVVELHDNSFVQPSVHRPKPRVIFVLEKASLVLAFVGKRYQILNPDVHASFMRSKKLNPYDYRPDIVHQALLRIMDSRIRAAGLLKAVYIRTDAGVLIKVEPNAVIPRKLESFCELMVQLLQKLSIKAKGGRGTLLRLVKNPIANHLPVNCKRIGLSFSSKKAVKLKDYIGSYNTDDDLVFVVGAMAHGKIDADYIDDLISVSQFPLSAGTCIRRIRRALERKWKTW